MMVNAPMSLSMARLPGWRLIRPTFSRRRLFKPTLGLFDRKSKTLGSES